MKRLFLATLLILILIGCAPSTQTPLPTTPTAIALPAKTSTPEPVTVPWWRNAIFYEIFVRSFYDSNGDGIGDFNGITQKLDYLQQLGINAIWLMPMHPSPSYHGYDVLNYYTVNPDYGTMDDFKRLLSEAHKRNIRIIIDLVLNHTSDQHPFFKDALRGQQSKYHDWYVWSDTDKGIGWHATEGNPPTYYFGLFCDCMPDLNYRNPDVTAEMEKVVKFWLEDIGVDGFRVDAAKHLIEEGQQVENTRATHEWFKGFYQAYKADNPNAFTVGEVFGADASLAKTYTGNQLDEVFNFEVANSILNSVNGGSNIGINSALTFATQGLPDGDYATFLTNHDQDRVMDQLSNDVYKAKVAASLLLTSPGTPFIYYGEEIGMSGSKPDEEIRRPMQWTSGPNAGFTTGTPWEALDTNIAMANVAKESADPQSLLAHYRSLIQIRNDHSALRDGEFYIVDSGNSALYAALRMNKEETVLVLINLSDQPISDFGLTLKDAVLTDGTYKAETLVGGEQVEGPEVTGGAFQNYKLIKEISPYSTLIVKFHS
jgi:glycosidase